MTEPSQKCENNAIFTQKRFISFKISYSCCFGLRGNLEFPDFLKKSFITSTSGAIFPFSFLHTYICIFMSIPEWKCSERD